VPVKDFRVSIYEIRERLNIKEGERVVFVSEGDRIYIKKMEA
jgi:AbrB family looped-hinge helix DNA binding protein